MLISFLLQIGPPSSRFLPSKDKKTWAAKDVADCVLSDKSSLKVTTSQRMAESSVLDAHTTDVLMESHTGIMNILFGNHQQNLHQNLICFGTM
uniref:Uncharacterized protein n=1 Tax=Aegilops tauschii subsp. strangulata TaxID=200361 RepID=A0A453T4I4_AEGTS